MGNALNAAIWAVIVVPIFAPIIIAVACPKVIMPTLTKPTIRTVVTPELCKRAVEIVPMPTLSSFLSAVLLNNVFIRLVASCSMFCVKRCTPTRNTPVPARTFAINNNISVVLINSPCAKNATFALNNSIAFDKKYVK